MLAQTNLKGLGMTKKTMMSITQNPSPSLGKTVNLGSNKIGFMTSKKSMAPSGILQPSVGTNSGSQSHQNLQSRNR